MTQVIKTTLIAGVGWPEKGEEPKKFKHNYVKPIRKFKPLKSKARNEHSEDLDEKFTAWLNKGFYDKQVDKKVSEVVVWDPPLKEEYLELQALKKAKQNGRMAKTTA